VTDIETDLRGARVLVVGASSGIGKAAAIRFARAGATVLAAARASERLQRAAEDIGAVALAFDIRDNAAVEAVLGPQPPFDHVVISAAQAKAGSVSGLSMEDARAAMESKFWGAYQVARAVKINPAGSLTFVSGVLGQRPSPAAVLQGAINSALEALARGLALELSPVRVNAISPGVIATPLWSGLPQETREAMFAASAQRLPAKRIGAPEDVAAAIFLAATNPFMTGTTLSVDGGGAIA